MTRAEQDAARARSAAVIGSSPVVRFLDRLLDEEPDHDAQSDDDNRESEKLV